MLRRKLILMLGPVVALLAIVSVVALSLLEGILRDLKHDDTQAWEIVERVNELGLAVDEVTADTTRVATEPALQIVRRAVGQLEAHTVESPKCAESCEQIKQALSDFQTHLAALAGNLAPADRAELLAHVAADSAALRRHAVELSRNARAETQQRDRAIVARFGGVVLGLGLVFLVLINAASVALVRTGVMVLRPVERLIEGSRELERGRLDYRLQVEDTGEFSELASAFNDLAQRLQDDDKRRVEMLGQVALTLNHELNNALAIIELRLHPLARQAGSDPGIRKCLSEIRENLARMARTIESFKHVRRIVLTDYVAGVKMLDLEESIRA